MKWYVAMYDVLCTRCHFLSYRYHRLSCKFNMNSQCSREILIFLMLSVPVMTCCVALYLDPLLGPSLSVSEGFGERPVEVKEQPNLPMILN